MDLDTPLFPWVFGIDPYAMYIFMLTPSLLIFTYLFSGLCFETLLIHFPLAAVGIRTIWMGRIPAPHMDSYVL